MKKDILLGLFMGLVALWSQSVFAAVNPGAVVLNEFYTNPSSGQEWYEILNTTSSPISLSDLRIERSATGDSLPLSGTLPAGGILVFTANSNPSNDAGDILILRDTSSDTMVSAVSYGTSTQDGVDHLDTAPGVDQSGIRLSGNYSVGSPTKGWFNDAVAWGDCSTIPASAPTLKSLNECLNTQAIVSNLNSVLINDPSNATGITFERRADLDESDTIIGKIQFPGPLNITDRDTIEYIMQLHGKLNISGDDQYSYVRVGLNTAGTDSVFHNSPAVITMYGLTSTTLPNPPEIIVKDDSEQLIDPLDDDYPTISNKIFDPAAGILSFNTDHFTFFEVAKTVLTGSIQYSKDGGTTYSSAITVKNGDTLRIRATFNAPVADSPAMQLVIDNGVLAATDMVKEDSTHYYYDLAVPAGDISPTVSFAQGVDAVGNSITVTPTGGATFTIDNTNPSDPVITQIGNTGNYINDANKGTVHVTGTAEAGSLVSVVLADSASPSTATPAVTQQLAVDSTAFDITVDTSTLLDGVITPSVTATDVAGNVSATVDTPTATKDTIAPSNQDTVFAASATNKGGDTITITSAGEDGGSVWFAPASTTAFTAGSTMTTATGTSTSILAPQDEGDYRLFVIDAAGNVSVQSTAILTIDNTRPSGTIEYSKDGGATYSSTISVKNGDILRIRATFDEALLDTPNVQISISGGILGASNMIKTSTTQYYYILAVGAGNLTPSISLSTGSDSAGNIVNSVPTNPSFTIDNTAPATPIITQIGNTGNYINDANKGTVHVTGTAEAGSLVSVVLTDSASTSTPAITQQLAIASTAFDITVNASALLDGVITPSVTATDGVGNNSNITNTPTAIKDVVAPNVTKLGDGTVDYSIAQAANVTLLFSEPINGDSQVLVEDAIVNGADRVLTFAWNPADDQLTITGNNSGITVFNNDVVVISLTDLAGNTSQSPLIIDSILSVGQIAPDGGGNVTLDNTNHQVVLTDPNQSVNIGISVGSTDPTIDVSSFINQGTGVLPGMNITANNASGITIQSPSNNTVTSSDNSWNGIIDAPRTVNPPIGMDNVDISVEFGVPGMRLDFNRGVRIVFPGQAGKTVQFSNDGIAYTEVTNICALDNQATGDALPVGGDCKIDVGGDLVIWTKHLTHWIIQSVPVTGIVVTGQGGATTITTNGGTLQLTATVSPANATNPAVTWSVINGSGSATISNTGLLTAVSNGTVTARATAQDGSDIFGDLVVTISNQGENNTNIGSHVYSIDYQNNLIGDVPANTSLDTFTLNIFTPTGAQFTVYQSNGVTPRVGSVFNLDKLIITAADGITTRTYTINVDNTYPAVTHLGDGLTDFILPQNGTAVLVFTKSISQASMIQIQNALINGADKLITFVWGNANTRLTLIGNASGNTTFANDVYVSEVTDSVGNTSNNVMLIDSALEGNQASPDIQGVINLDNVLTEAIINNSNPANIVNIPPGVNNPTINIGSLINNGVGQLPQVTINGNNAGGVVVDFPQGAIVTSSNLNWNGIISGPYLSNATFPNETVGLAFQIGAPGMTLTFDKAIRIKMPGQAWKRVKFSNDGINYTEITTYCTQDTQAAGDLLPAGGDCKMNVGGDLVIWTKHFTTFVAFTSVAPAPAPSSGGAVGGGVVLTSSGQTAITGGKRDYDFIFNNGTSIIARDEVAIVFSGAKRFKSFSVANGRDFTKSVIEKNIGFKIWKISGGIGRKEICVRFYDDRGTATAPVCHTVMYLDRAFFEALAAKKAQSIKQAPVVVPTPKPVIKVVQTYKEEERPPVSRLDASYPPKKENILDYSLPLGKNITLSGLVKTIKYGDYSTHVRNLQNLLKAYGFFPKNLEITGYYGDDTLASVEKYKKFVQLNSKYQNIANK